MDHPSNIWDPSRLSQLLYLNPHDPPPGGHAKNLLGHNRIGFPGSGGSRWTTPAVSGKSVEVQRSQVDEVFKSLRGGDELEETEPSTCDVFLFLSIYTKDMTKGSDIGTKLYPHQKKALTFLLEREREIENSGGKPSSLWQIRRSFRRGQAWVNLVTQKEVYEQPRECKGALLADDVRISLHGRFWITTPYKFA